MRGLGRAGEEMGGLGGRGEERRETEWIELAAAGCGIEKRENEWVGL